MKSLEIVNDLIWKTQKKYDYVDTNQDKKQLEKQLEELNSEFNKLQQVKQDLEVLEIIRKKKVYFVHLNNYLFLYDKNEEVLEKYNKNHFYHNELTMEELLKLKQWLEDNE